MYYNTLPVDALTDILFSDENSEKIYTDFFKMLSDYLPLAKAEIIITSDEKKYKSEFPFTVNSSAEEGTVRTFSYRSREHFVSVVILTFDMSCTITPEDERALNHIMKVFNLSVSYHKYMELVEKSRTYNTNTGFLTADGFHKIIINQLENNLTDGNTVVFLNIKNFKMFNQKYGHGKGNLALQAVGKGLDNYLDNDGYFAYLGGDNYVVYIGKERLEAFLKHITKFPVEIWNENGETEKYYLTFNAGVCDIFQAEDCKEYNPSYVIENAQIAMNIAKNDPSIGNIVHFRKKIKDRIMYEKELETSMKSALENGEFIVKYQPKVNLENYQLTGSEALVRWNRNGKTMPPDDFIPIFEKNGFVCTLDFYVLDVVCRDMKSWIDKGISPVKVSVNFSKTHVEDPYLVEKIVDIIEKYNVPSELIEIEFTENSFVENPQNIKDVINQLKENGITTSMDDFGTGYSSFNMLKEMFVDNLKLDKSFLNHNENEDPRKEIIIKNIIKMAKELEIEVISEGVETVEQVNMLHCLDCDTAQGFFFDKPLYANEYELRLANIHYKPIA